MSGGCDVAQATSRVVESGAAAGPGEPEDEVLSETAGIFWVVIAAILFGSQFVLNRLSAGMPSASYNATMALGIAAGSGAALIPLGFGSIAPPMALLAFLGGAIWVVGNYLFIVAVARVGIARSYVVINFSAVLSFAGGIVFLGELPGLGGSRLLLVAAAVALVLAGSWLVTTTAPRGGSPGGPDGSQTVRGLLAAFASTAFFAAYNVLAAYVMNRAGTPAGATLIAVAPGIAAGAFAVAALAPGALRAWRAAPLRSHVLAALQGATWAAAMVCILFGWMGVGIALGTSIQVGAQTLVSSLWGILLFGELDGTTNRRAAGFRFAAGAALTVCGIVGITAV